MFHTSIAPPLKLATLATCLVAITITQTAVHAQEPAWNDGGDLFIHQSITSTQDIHLHRPLTLDIGKDHVVQLHGSVSGPVLGLHALTKNGTGRLELWGDNRNLTQQVNLRQGSLHLAGRYALGQDWWAALNIHPGTELSYEHDAIVAASLHLNDTPAGSPTPGIPLDVIRWRVEDGVATHIGMIHGTAPLIKTGSGTLRLLEAALDPAGHMTVEQGMVQLGSQFSGHIDVRHGAALSGSGRAGWLTVGSGATLAPDKRLSVDHALYFDPDSQLQIRAWHHGQHDRVDVTAGPAVLNGHVVVLPQGSPEDWQNGMDAVIVHARDGLGTSRFDSVTSTVPYLDTELSYDANQVMLHLRPRAQGLPPVPAGVSSGWAMSVRNILADDSRFIRDAVYRQADHRGPVWSYAFHSSGRYTGTTPDSQIHRRIQGLLLGTDLSIAPAWRLGLLAGLSRTEISKSPHTAHATGTGHSGDDISISTPQGDVDSLHAGLYAHHHGGWGGSLTAGAAFSQHRVHSQRRVAHTGLHDTLRSRYRTRTVQVFGQIDHPVWHFANGRGTLTPFARLAWVRTRQPDHIEHGGPLALRYARVRQDLLYASLGIHTRQQLMLPKGRATLQGRLAWRQAGGSTHAGIAQHFRDDIHRHPVHARGLTVPRQAWQLDLGLQANISPALHVGLSYSGQYSRGRRDHGIRAKISMML